MAKDKLFCPACQADAPVLVKPLFEGFEKVGEQRSCTFCGHVFGSSDPDEARPEAPRPKRVDAADLFGQSYHAPKPVNPFSEPIELSKPVNPFGGPVEAQRAQNPFGDEKDPTRICRNCKSYVVNPFTQKCMLHQRDVTAFDTCEQFERKAKP